MYTILILSIVVGVAVADVSELRGYHYDKPRTSYGVPSYTIGSKYSTGFATGSGFGPALTAIGSGISNDGLLTSITPGSELNNIGITPLPTVISTTAPTFTEGFISGESLGFTGGNGHIFNAGLSGIYEPTHHYQTAAQYPGFQYPGYPIINQQTRDIVRSGPPQVFKHFYVHAAPEEPELPKPKQPLVLPPKQKHYNIIFVKTPTPTAGTSQVIPLPQESEEKTIVYVLVQKPEEIKDVVLPTFTPTPPSKPEVFFIKYDGKDDAHGVINNIVQDYQKHDSVTFNGIGVGHDEIPGDHVVIHDTLSNAYGVPLSGPSLLDKFVSSTEGSKIELSSTTPGYGFGSTSSSLLADSGLGGFENTNEVIIGPSHVNDKFVSSSNKFGGSGYQALKIQTGSIGSTGFETSSVSPIEVSSTGPTSTLHAIVTGSDIISTTPSSLENISIPISTSLNVPFETYGPPNFKPFNK